MFRCAGYGTHGAAPYDMIVAGGPKLKTPRACTAVTIGRREDKNRGWVFGIEKRGLSFNGFFP